MRRRTCHDLGIVAMLRAHVQDRDVAEICREHGTRQLTFHQWESMHGGMQTSDLKERRALRKENIRLKIKVADIQVIVLLTCGQHSFAQHRLTRGHTHISTERSQHFHRSGDLSELERLIRGAYISV